MEQPPRQHPSGAIMDMVNAPTLNSLNKPQKRALIMRDQLRFETEHRLDDFIQGIAPIEPPAYKSINGTVYPALEQVTLKDIATRFYLGNVHFENDASLGNGIYQAYLTFEDGRFEIRTAEALPVDEDNLYSVPIHAFIAKNMVPMFEDKFKAIHKRVQQINEVREAAFKSAEKPVEQFKEGEVCDLACFGVTVEPDLLHISLHSNTADLHISHSPV